MVLKQKNSFKGFKKYKDKKIYLQNTKIYFLYYAFRQIAFHNERKNPHLVCIYFNIYAIFNT